MDSDDDLERKRLLEIVSRQGLRGLTVPELERLQILLQKKNYDNNDKANRSKKKLLKQINSAIYDALQNNKIRK